MAYIIKGKTAEWEVIVGLEVHCQVLSESKLFSGAPTRITSYNVCYTKLLRLF